MTNAFEFARWATRFRALLLATFATTLVACDATDEITSVSDVPAETADPASPAGDASFATAFRGGIPMGHFALPTSKFGSEYNGAMRNIWPGELLSELRAIKARGGKVVLMMAGNERHYKSDGKFSLSKWKARIDRYRNVNFDSFIRDGTLIAHYLIDEPNDPRNWGGRPVSPATVEEMAKYSKQRWEKRTGPRHRPQHQQGRSESVEAERFHDQDGWIGAAGQLISLRLHQLDVRRRLPVQWQCSGCAESHSQPGAKPGDEELP
jgi:hypothetical protein